MKVGPENLHAYYSSYAEYTAQRTLIDLHGGEYAKVVRERQNMSVRKFAAMLGVSPSWLSKLERGMEIMPAPIARKLLEIAGEW